MPRPLDIVICPGCGSKLPKRNRGTCQCGYGAGLRMKTLAELIEAPGYGKLDALNLGDVSADFLRALAAAVREDERAALSGPVKE